MIHRRHAPSTIPAAPAASRAAARNHLRQALLERRSGDLERAEASLRRALDATPDFAEALYQLGLIRARRGDRLGARNLLLAALRASERDPPQPVLAMKIAEQLARLLPA